MDTTSTYCRSMNVFEERRIVFRTTSSDCLQNKSERVKKVYFQRIHSTSRLPSTKVMGPVRVEDTSFMVFPLVHPEKVWTLARHHVLEEGTPQVVQALKYSLDTLVYLNMN